MTQWVPVHEGVPESLEWEEVGNLRGPRGPRGSEVLPYTMSGGLAVRPGTAAFPVAGGPFLIATVAAMVGTGPVGSDIVLDVRVSGVSIYAPQAQPRIPSGQRTAVIGPHTPTTLTEGDYVTVDVVSVGDVLPGADLTVVIRLDQP